MKKILCTIMVLVMTAGIFAGCNNSEKKATSSVASRAVVVTKEDGDDYAINPLTGKVNLKPDALYMKPVAIMINNIDTAWGVQSSLSKADVIYETYVEGGITRIMAVFKDIRTVGKNKIGSLRSGRYSYVDLATGMGAQFVHAGIDETYCGPHIEETGITSVDLNTDGTVGSRKGGNSYAFRWDNGLSYEHTLFTKGNDLYKGLNKLVNLKLKKPQKSFMNFSPEDQKITPNGKPCKSLTVHFSIWNLDFKYNEKTGLYDKYRNGEKQKDNATGKTLSFQNVFVLPTNVTYFPDNKHVKTDLSSGTGYYVSNGAYQKIKWEKGSASDRFKFKTLKGKKLKVNAGKTYICLNNLSDESQTVFSKK